MYIFEDNIKLEGSDRYEEGGSYVESIYRYWSQTVVIDVYLNVNWEVVFYEPILFPPGIKKCAGGRRKIQANSAADGR